MRAGLASSLSSLVADHSEEASSAIEQISSTVERLEAEDTPSPSGPESAYGQSAAGSLGGARRRILAEMVPAALETVESGPVLSRRFLRAPRACCRSSGVRSFDLRRWRRAEEPWARSKASWLARCLARRLASVARASSTSSLSWPQASGGLRLTMVRSMEMMPSSPTAPRQRGSKARLRRRPRASMVARVGEESRTRTRARTRAPPASTTPMAASL
mmetsp:Transcript_8355/g.25938  ORF Transcript_8355/g.25938 Transcript_8355/m.25938 type:complete len:217 (-) Transcript_8355:1095-1745(-)